MNTVISELAAYIAANLIDYVDAYYFPQGEQQLAEYVQGLLNDQSKQPPRAIDPSVVELQRQLEIYKEAMSSIRFSANEAITQASALGRPVDDLELSVRSRNILEREGITTIAQLVYCPVDKLLHTPGLGRKGFAEMREALSHYNLTLGMRP